MNPTAHPGNNKYYYASHQAHGCGEHCVEKGSEARTPDVKVGE